MGRGTDIGKIRRADPFRPTMPMVPTENKGIMSGPMRRKRKGRIDRRGSRRGGIFGGSSVVQVTMKDPKTGRMYGGMVKDGVPQFKKPDFLSDEDFNKSFPKLRTPLGKPTVSPPLPRSIGQRPLTPEERELDRRRRPIRDRYSSIGEYARDFGRPAPSDRPLTGGYNPESGVRYTDTGVPTAVEQTRRVPVQDPTLGGPPEREVPIPKERRQRITRESDPRGDAPFSPDERAMARDRFFERMFERADERKQQKSMERAERDNVGDALRSERELRESEMARPGDERFVSTEEKERRQMRRQKQEFDEFKRTGRRRRRRGGGMRRRRGRRRDFTRRRSRMEGGRRGRSMEERAAFRDRYVSTLRGGFFS